MKINTITRIPTSKDLMAALQRGEDSIREAAAIIVQMVEADPKAYQKIHKETGLHWNVLANLERVGRGSMNYNLLFDTSPAARYIAALPESQQTEVYEQGVQILETQDGKTTVEIKKVQDLTPQQARLVFAEKHVRTVDEQMKHSAAPAVKISKPGQRYFIEGDKLTILTQTTLTMTQLEEILEKMKAQAIKKLATKKL